MSEMEGALRSCMEQLLIAREEREQIIVEAASEISSEKKKARELQRKLDAATKKAAKLAAENSSLAKALDAKDAAIGELRESKSASDGELAGARARLDAAQKQAASLQYEVRMLQKELEIRGQEREYDLQSVDASRRQQAESQKKIALLEGECQRLRAMHETPAAAAKLRAVEDENKALKQTLAKRDAELQFVQMKYADEACKLSVLQRQLSELTEENKQLSDAHGQTESWASALISELEQFRAAKLQGAAASEMSLLDDFAEIERLEMASGGQGLRSPKNAHSEAISSEKNGKDTVIENGVSNGQPEWVQDMCKLVMQKHETSGENIDTILEEITRALDQSANNQKGDDLNGSYDWSIVKEMVSSLTEKITSVIGISEEGNVASSQKLLLDRSEFCARLEHLVHVCHDLLHGKTDLEKFVHEVCLVLEYIINQYKHISFQEQSDTVNNDTENLDGEGSFSNMNGGCDINSPKSASALDIQTEALEESIQLVEGRKTDHILVNQEESQLDEELTRVILDQDEKISQENSASCEIESPHDHPSAETLAEKEEKHLASSSEISAAAEKLAECQETITNLSRQLRALKSPAVSGNLDSPMPNSRPSSSDYKPQSLACILAEGEDSSTEDAISPATKEVRSKKEPDAASRKSVAQDGSVNAALKAVEEELTQTVVHPIFPEPSQETISSDLKKKRRSPSLLGRIMFRKKVEGS
uniref:Filament-like plant protein 7 n=1 Tax=Oryza barthii TaxID=65489 RepID=A0A0D3F7L4_9ORYZ